MMIFAVSMLLLSQILRKWLVPKIPAKYLKYKGLALSLLIPILALILRLPLDFSALNLPFYILALAGLGIFIRDINKKGL
ncbi:hypothetical protein OZX60_03210 [Streptococcaceae bacterium ESL0687]|nr:hypothetical protein OZX60_03210 [Streptococcaceae bacterium ESL0687]